MAYDPRKDRIQTIEAVTQVEVKAGANFKTYLFIACSTRETLFIGQGTVPFN
jgi:hypothetical protein